MIDRKFQDLSFESIWSGRFREDEAEAFVSIDGGASHRVECLESMDRYEGAVFDQFETMAFDRIEVGSFRASRSRWLWIELKCRALGASRTRWS